ncbi:hypothetical protein [Nocardia sp. NBC_01327]|uniref:hypothetical protein n=1 Tax=Nocardia sp. NBC_01327 TaxID=2903593 RepID=UPI002E119B0C|nr:hypothetical protein OG326_41850 [Nocardia sp. NBC_01327]
MALEILPEDLPVISAQLSANHASLTSVIAAAAAAALPGSAGCDAVSTSIIGPAFHAYQPQFFGVTATGLAHMQTRAELLGPVSLMYAASDQTGGAEVTAQVAGLAT